MLLQPDPPVIQILVTSPRSDFGTERLPADAGRISNVIFEVLQDDVFSDCSIGDLLQTLTIDAQERRE